MLGQEIYQIKLQEPLYKILQISSAVQNSFVLLVIEHECQNEKLIHMNQQGKIIQKYSFNSSCQEFIMINQSQILTVLVFQNKISMISLQTKKITIISHNFSTKIDHLQLFQFSQTKMICIKQEINNQQPILILTYYNYDQIINQIPQIIFQSIPGQFQNNILVNKINNFSKIAWCNHIQSENYILIIIHQIINSLNHKFSQIQHIKIKNNIHIHHLSTNLFSKLWQFTHKQLIIIKYPSKQHHYHSKQFIHKIKIQQEQQSDLIPYLLEINLPIEIKQNLIEFTFMDCHIIVLSYNWREQSTVLYFYHYFKEEITIITNRRDTFQTKLYCNTHDPNIILWSQFKNNSACKLTLTKSQPLQLQEIYTHFLLHLNQQFDDDLISDALDLLKNK